MFINFCLFHARSLLPFSRHYQTPPTDQLTAFWLMYKLRSYLWTIIFFCWISVQQLSVLVTNSSDKPYKRGREFFCLTTQIFHCMLCWPLVLCGAKHLGREYEAGKSCWSLESEEAKRQSRGLNLSFKSMPQWAGILHLENTRHRFHYTRRAP